MLSSTSSLGRPFLQRWGNKILNLCNGIQLGYAPESTLTSNIMVPALPDTLIVASVIILDLWCTTSQAYSQCWCCEPIYYWLQSKKTCYMYLLHLILIGLCFLILYFCFWRDQVFECHSVCSLLWLFLRHLLLLEGLPASTTTVTPHGYPSLLLVLRLLLLEWAYCSLGCNLRMTNSSEMIRAFALATDFPISRVSPSLMSFATLMAWTPVTGPTFSNGMSR